MSPALLFVSIAMAGEPVLTHGEDSRITAYVDLEASPKDVFTVVSDPKAVADIDGTTTVETSPDGECLAVTVHVDHPLAKTTYHTRSCPDGALAVRETLTGGNAMKEYESRFWIEERESGSRLHYEIRTVAALPIPQFIVNRQTAKGAERMLTRLRDHFHRKTE